MNESAPPAAPALAKPVDVFTRPLLEAMRPEPRITVSEWADQFRWLSGKSASEPGKWRTDRTPYLREIMDSLSPHSSVEEVTFMAGAQVGKTECGSNWIGTIMDRYPAPIMIVWPTVPFAKRMSKTRIQPLIDSTPRLAARVTPNRTRDSGNTIFEKDFPGGNMIITGANSAVSLRGASIKYLFEDEIDGWPGDADGEGDPVTLAEARTANFPRRKIFRTSTPKFRGSSRIERFFLRGDQRRYHVPCPHCGHFQVLQWSGLHWEKGKPETVFFACAECAGVIIEGKHKTAMLAAGRWIPMNPSARPEERSYHLSSLYSPLGWRSWEQCVRKFEEADGNVDTLRAWTNTYLGETYQVKGDVPDWERLFNRREDYKPNTLHRRVSVITIGADVQKNRIEYHVIGWGRDFENWSIDYQTVMGDPDLDETWLPIAELLTKTWRHPTGAFLDVRAIGVDATYSQSIVCAWTRTQPRKRVFALRGDVRYSMLYGSPKPVDISTKGRRIANAAMIWPAGTGVAKAELYGWLKAEPPTDPRKKHSRGFSHFPQYGEEWFQQLCAEQLISVKNRGNFVRYEWVKIRDRNEVLDTYALGRIALAISGVDRWRPEDWTRHEHQLGLDQEVPGGQTDLVEVTGAEAPAIVPTVPTQMHPTSAPELRQPPLPPKKPPPPPQRSRDDDYWGRRGGKSWL